MFASRHQSLILQGEEDRGQLRTSAKNRVPEVCCICLVSRDIPSTCDLPSHVGPALPHALVDLDVFVSTLQILEKSSGLRPFFTTWSHQYQAALNHVARKQLARRSGRARVDANPPRDGENEIHPAPQSDDQGVCSTRKRQISERQESHRA